VLSARAENIVSILNPGRKLTLAHEPLCATRLKARVHRCRAGGFVDDPPFGQVRRLNFDFAIIHLAFSRATLRTCFWPEEREASLVNTVRKGGTQHYCPTSVKAIQRDIFAPTSCSLDAYDNSTAPIISYSTTDLGVRSER
jgi:hypothetical protein